MLICSVNSVTSEQNKHHSVSFLSLFYKSAGTEKLGESQMSSIHWTGQPSAREEKLFLCQSFMEENYSVNTFIPALAGRGFPEGKATVVGGQVGE